MFKMEESILNNSALKDLKRTFGVVNNTPKYEPRLANSFLHALVAQSYEFIHCPTICCTDQKA